MARVKGRRSDKLRIDPRFAAEHLRLNRGERSTANDDTMSRPAKTFPWTIAIGLLLVLMTVALLVLLATLKSRMVRQQSLPVLGQVGSFTLTNQLGQAVSLDDLKGTVWIADVVFTRCAGPCPRMTARMKELQDAIPTASNTRLVTLTTDPEFDSPSVLKTYAERFGANHQRWMFVTGPKSDLVRVAVDGLKLAVLDVEESKRTSPEDLFIHSTYFVLVDKRGQLRAVFDTESEQTDWPAVKQRIVSSVKQLERER